MNVNYCALVEPMKIYPDDLRRIMVLLETVLFPTNTVDQFLMKGITDFMREKLVEYNNKQCRNFEDMYVTTWTCCDEEDEDNPANEANTEVTVASDFPYASDEEKQEIKAKSVKRVVNRLKKGKK